MMDPRDRALLIEAATSAWRPAGERELPVHPAWYDLDEQGREQAFAETRSLRVLEAATDENGWSSTVHSVLRRLERATE